MPEGILVLQRTLAEVAFAQRDISLLARPRHHPVAALPQQAPGCADRWPFRPQGHLPRNAPEHGWRIKREATNQAQRPHTARRRPARKMPLLRTRFAGVTCSQSNPRRGIVFGTEGKESIELASSNVHQKREETP